MTDITQDTQRKICGACLTAESRLACGACAVALCKSCAHFQDKATFSLLNPLPEDLSHEVYCPTCHEGKLIPAQESYSEMMEKAKSIYVFFKKHQIPLIRRSKNQISVSNIPDKDEALLRMAFSAAEQGFNALIEANLVSEKVYVNHYQSLIWSGTACPAEIRAATLEENRLKVKNEKPQPERIQKKRK